VTRVLVFCPATPSPHTSHSQWREPPPQKVSRLKSAVSYGTRQPRTLLSKFYRTWTVCSKILCIKKHACTALGNKITANFAMPKSRVNLSNHGQVKPKNWTDPKTIATQIPTYAHLAKNTSICNIVVVAIIPWIIINNKKRKLDHVHQSKPDLPLVIMACMAPVLKIC
jgi:hypothetical protein